MFIQYMYLYEHSGLSIPTVYLHSTSTQIQYNLLIIHATFDVVFAFAFDY